MPLTPHTVQQSHLLPTAAPWLLQTSIRYRPHSHQHDAQQPNTTADEAQCKQDFGLHQLQQTTIKQRCCNTGSCCSCNLPYISPSASHQRMVHHECMVVLYQHSSIGIPQARGRFATIIHCESCYTLNIVFNLVHSDCDCIGVALTTQLSCHGIEILSGPTQPIA